MKGAHRERILERMKAKGYVTRAELASAPRLYGLHFDRRIRELDNEYQIERVFDNLEDGTKYIVKWVFKGAHVTGQMPLKGVA